MPPAASTAAEGGAPPPPPPAADGDGARATAFVADTVKERTGLDDVHAKDMEIGIFNWCLAYAEAHRVMRSWKSPAFRDLYACKARSVFANIDPSSYVGNTSLLSRLLNREVAPHDVAFMTPDKAYPERWQHVIDAKSQREEYMKSARPAAMTDQFVCKRCKSRRCEYTELQLRSCDEPATLFITCCDCSFRWRIG